MKGKDGTICCYPENGNIWNIFQIIILKQPVLAIWSFFIGYKLCHNDHAPAWSHERLIEWINVSKKVIEEEKMLVRYSY